MKPSAKWSIFRILNYLHAAGAISMLGLFAYSFEDMHFESSFNVVLFIILLAGLFSVIGNAGINLLLLERYYPATMPEEKIWRWGNICFVVSIILMAVLSFLFAISLQNFSPRSAYGYQIIDLLATSFIAVILATALPVLWMEVVLKRKIKANYKQEMESFLTADS